MDWLYAGSNACRLDVTGFFLAFKLKDLGKRKNKTLL
jgi:hypothetical protein